MSKTLNFSFNRSKSCGSKALQNLDGLETLTSDSLTISQFISSVRQASAAIGTGTVIGDIINVSEVPDPLEVNEIIVARMTVGNLLDIGLGDLILQFNTISSNNSNIKLVPFININPNLTHVLIDKNLKLKLIDFEKLSIPGIWVSDTLYFYATLYALVSSQRNMKKKVKKMAYDYIHKKEPKIETNDINHLIDIFCFAGESNSRFRLHNNGIKLSAILNFVLSIRRLA